MSWGAGIVTSPLRVLATIAWLAARRDGMARDAARVADAGAARSGTLAVAGTFGVAAYLNLKAGASLGWGMLPDDAPHEARERDYFFVLGFWAWGCLAGAGAVALARAARERRSRRRCVALALPLAGNWRSADRSREPEASAARTLRAGAARRVAAATRCCSSTATTTATRSGTCRRSRGYAATSPRDGAAAAGGLVPGRGRAAIGPALEGRPGERSPDAVGAACGADRRGGARRRTARRGLAGAARTRAGAARRGVGAARARVRVAGAGRDARLRAEIDSASAARWLAGRRPWPRERRSPSGDDVARVMMRLLDCPRLASGADTSGERRDSLEVRCNLR